MEGRATEMSGATTRSAVICESVRTPVGRYGGMFKDVPVTDLASTVVKGLAKMN